MIIWTRAKADWDKDSRLIASAKADVYRLPCVEYIDLTADIDLASLKTKYDVVIISSPRAVDFLVKHEQLKNRCEKISNFLCFGMSTAERLAEDFNLVTQIASVKSSRDFAKWLSEKKIYQNYLVIGARDSIIDWKNSITHEDATVDYVPLYQTIENCDVQVEANKFSDKVVVCFAAPSSVRAFVQSHSYKQLEKKSIQAVAIGRTTEQECEKHFNNTYVSSEANLESMLNHALLLDKE